MFHILNVYYFKKILNHFYGKNELTHNLIQKTGFYSVTGFDFFNLFHKNEVSISMA